MARVLKRAGWVVPPVGAGVEAAFREGRGTDLEGNRIVLREQWQGGAEPR